MGLQALVRKSPIVQRLQVLLVGTKLAGIEQIPIIRMFGRTVVVDLFSQCSGLMMTLSIAFGNYLNDNTFILR